MRASEQLSVQEWAQCALSFALLCVRVPNTLRLNGNFLHHLFNLLIVYQLSTSELHELTGMKTKKKGTAQHSNDKLTRRKNMERIRDGEKKGARTTTHTHVMQMLITTNYVSKAMAVTMPRIYTTWTMSKSLNECILDGILMHCRVLATAPEIAAAMTASLLE